MTSIVFDYLSENYLEIIAAIAGITGVFLTAKEIIWCWPVALINVVLSAIVFYQSRLYQDAILQIFYFVMTIYGFYFWLKGGKENTAPPIRHITFSLSIVLLSIGIIFTFLSGWFFEHYTDASLPYLDATTTVWGIIGTFLMARKMIENWWLWIVIDLLCTGIYIYKHLFVFSFLYFFFTILAVYGLIEWQKKIKLQQS